MICHENYDLESIVVFWVVTQCSVVKCCQTIWCHVKRLKHGTWSYHREGTVCIVSLKKCVVLTEECIVVVIREELIGTTEYLIKTFFKFFMTWYNGKELY